MGFVQSPRCMLFPPFPHSYVAAMQAPSGRSSDVPNRLKRQFAIFCVPMPDEAMLGDIFGPLVRVRISPKGGGGLVLIGRRPANAGSCRPALLHSQRTPPSYPLLQARFDARLVGSAAASAAAALVPMTLALWRRLQAKMLPTPAREHYRFTMHELAKVFQGLLMADVDGLDGAAGGGRARVLEDVGSVATPDGYVAALWAHECARVFGDRMVSSEDAAYVAENAMDIARCGPGQGPGGLTTGAAALAPCPGPQNYPSSPINHHPQHLPGRRCRGPAGGCAILRRFHAGCVARRRRCRRRRCAAIGV